jgi:leucyl-tRNA---protein transferase
MQRLSFFPAIPPPVPVSLVEIPEHSCSYLPDRESTSRAFLAEGMDAEVYQRFMDAGFRRSGKVIYQPTCRGCRACVPLRVVVNSFTPDKTQRRCWRKNSDLSVTTGEPNLTEEKFSLYQEYLRDWHGRDEKNDWDGLREFLYDSPVDTLEMEYRDANGTLLGVGICDVCPDALSSVYFFFDPREASRSLGTYSVMKEVAFAREHGMKHVYLGYWVLGCGKMEYKMQFRPCEVLHGDAQWRPVAAEREPVDRK